MAPALSTLGSPALRPVLWLAGAFFGLLALAVFMAAFDDGRDSGEAVNQTAEPTVTTTPTTVAPTTTTPSLPVGGSRTATCAGLDDRKQAIDRDKQQVEETYRDDHETRDRLKAELEAEKQAIDAQKQALGC